MSTRSKLECLSMSTTIFQYLRAEASFNSTSLSMEPLMSYINFDFLTINLIIVTIYSNVKKVGVYLSTRGAKEAKVLTLALLD